MAPEALEVLLTTEGTYPIERGGVSTWCDLLMKHMPEARFQVLTVMANPYLPARFTFPSNQHRWIKVPLWGTEDPAEGLDLETPLLLARRERTTPAVVRSEFLPLFTQLVERLWSPAPDPPNLANVMLDLYNLFQLYDYHTLFKDLAVWEWYCDAVVGHLAPRYALSPSLHDLAESLGWLYRFLSVLQVPVPRCDITHASAASFCAIPGVVARLLRGTPLLITEHGVYLREQYHNVGQSPLSPFLKRVLLRLVEAVCHTAYATADALAPVAAFNARWELALGIAQERIHIIHNGVDQAVYHPRPRPAGSVPTVISLSRIDPAKDLATLMRAAALIIKEQPGTRFVVYGDVSVPAYHEQLLALRDELQLSHCFQFAGHCPDVAIAVAGSSVVALSSVTEGFPYSVIEAMMCARPVVATDVGGVSEAIGDAGILVPPRAPEALASAILRLLCDPDLAANLGAAARRRAEKHFAVDQFVGRYRHLYEELAKQSQGSGDPNSLGRGE